MKKAEAYRLMAEIDRKSRAWHLCATCTFTLEKLLLDKTKDMVETTQDVNVCELYARTWENEDIPYACDKETGNTRVHLDGFKTKDNGGGYWITECPYYQKVE